MTWKAKAPPDLKMPDPVPVPPLPPDSRSKISREQWSQLTQRLHGEVCHLFKPKENQVIQDFIVTAAEDVERVQCISKHRD